MKKDTKFSFLRDYFAFVLIFFFCLFAAKCVEAFQCEGHVVEVISFGIYNNLLFYASILIIVGFLGFLINLFSPTTAKVVAVVILASSLISEISLAVYFQHNGYLYGSELLTRPLPEQWIAVKGAAGVFLPFAVPIVVIALFLFIFNFLKKKRESRIVKMLSYASMAVVFGFFIISLIAPPNLIIKPKDKTKRFKVSKVYYCGADCLFYLRNKEYNNSFLDENGLVIVDEEMIASFLEDNKHFQPLDSLYPLERYDNTPDNLSEYFNDSKVVPDVVVIIAESLGAEFVDNGTAPFFDSLSKQSLIWYNGVSSTPRSFGAVPAITGSVVGPSSFQFGNMPDHNTMLSMLKDAGYQINCHHGFNWSYEQVGDYLHAQNVDYMSDYYYQYLDNKKTMPGSSWGAHDEVVFAKTLEKIDEGAGRPQLNLIVTLSMHEELELNDERQGQYLKKAQEIKEKNNIPLTAGRIASTLYFDDCLRTFFEGYSKKHSFKNTIFIITGDHSCGKTTVNPLDYHHTPIVIYSPLLKTHKEFYSVVTHHDITPSVMRLLNSKYHVKMPSTVHYIGEGLDTSIPAQFNRNLLVVNTDMSMRHFLCGKYLYSTPTLGDNEHLYELDTTLYQHAINDKEIANRCRQIMNEYLYIHFYTYLNNRLTRRPIKNENFQVVDSIVLPETLKCVALMEKPSSGKIFKEFLIRNKNLDSLHQHKKCRVTLEAGVQFNDILRKQEYMNIRFDIDSDQKYFTYQGIVDFIQEQDLTSDKIYLLKIQKTFDLSATSSNIFNLSIESKTGDDYWVAGSTMTLHNGKIIIEFGD